MPRLPTMRVMGSQDISTSLRVPVVVSARGVVTVAMVFLLRTLLLKPIRKRGQTPFSNLAVVGRGVVAGGQFAAAVPPLRFLVDRRIGQGAEPPNDAPV